MTHADNHGDTTEQAAKLYYYHADHLQSAQFITDANGEKYEHIEYTPYGELWIEETAPGVDKLPFRFTGKELDEETGLYYYGARYLDPKYSRWLSGDPAITDYMAGSSVGEGGIYNTKDNEPRIGGSLGCFGLNGRDSGNTGRDKFMKDIRQRLNNSGGRIEIYIQRLDN